MEFIKTLVMSIFILVTFDACQHIENSNLMLLREMV